MSALGVAPSFNCSSRFSLAVPLLKNINLNLSGDYKDRNQSDQAVRLL